MVRQTAEIFRHCQFCDRGYKAKGLRAHERYCPQRPKQVVDLGAEVASERGPTTQEAMTVVTRLMDPPFPQGIKDHEGKKYLRTIRSCVNGASIEVDVYDVLEAFGISLTCNATGHCIKKLLCAGHRGKGTRLQDLIGAQAALSRAIEIQRNREYLEREDVHEHSAP